MYNTFKIEKRLDLIFNRIGEYEGKDVPEFLKQDVKGLIYEILSTVNKSVSIDRLESSLVASESIDVSSLKEALNLFSEVDWEEVKQQQLGNINAKNAFDDLAVLINGLETHQEHLPLLEKSLRLEMGADHLFFNMLIYTFNDSIITNKLKEMLNKKVALLSDEQALESWSRVQNEFDDSSLTYIKASDDMTSEKFLNVSSAKEAREKLVKYVVEVKPLLVSLMLKNGQNKFPWGIFGVGRILSWLEVSNVVELSTIELGILRSISRIFAFWEQVFFEDIVDLKSALQMSNLNRLSKGIDFRDAENFFRDNRQKSFTFLGAELRILLNFLEEYVTLKNPVEIALTQYKLGLELMMPEIIRAVKKSRELFLQKHLCKYLLYKNIYSIGTKFGQSEVDLLTEDLFDPLILETKVFDSTVNSKLLRNGIVQLESYMNQGPIRRRGVMIIYNFSNKLISAPRKWIAGRFWILPINLMLLTPSKRRSVLLVDEGTDNELLSFREVCEIRKRTKDRKGNF